jgi:iron complex transport system permease protein
MFRIILLIILNLTFVLLNLLFKDGINIMQIYQNETNTFGSILELRSLSILLAIGAGAGLSLVGLFLQTIFSNPLASPFTLGISPIVSLIVSIFLIFIPTLGYFSIYWLYLVQFLVSMIAALGLLFWIQKINKNNGNATFIILIGVLLGSFSGAIQQIIEFNLSADLLKQNALWNLGNFQAFALWIPIAVLFIIIICSIFLKKMTYQANIFLLGIQYARNLGLDTNQFIKIIIFISSIITSVITITCGPIGFIGLMAPHISKIWLKSNNHKVVFLPTLLIGIFFCLFALWTSQLEFWNGSLSINIVLSIIGVPFTLFLLLKKN